jgi:hypothetical protein
MSYQLLRDPIEAKNLGHTPAVPPPNVLYSGGGVANFVHGGARTLYLRDAERNDVFGNSMPRNDKVFGNMYNSGPSYLEDINPLTPEKNEARFDYPYAWDHSGASTVGGVDQYYEGISPAQSGKPYRTSPYSGQTGAPWNTAQQTRYYPEGISGGSMYNNAYQKMMGMKDPSLNRTGLDNPYLHHDQFMDPQHGVENFTLSLNDGVVEYGADSTAQPQTSIISKPGLCVTFIMIIILFISLELWTRAFSKFIKQYVFKKEKLTTTNYVVIAIIISILFLMTMYFADYSFEIF